MHILIRQVHLDRKKNHKCGFSICKICKCEREYNHECFMPRIRDRIAGNTRDENNEDVTTASIQEPVIFIFYDFETQQNQTVAGDPKTNIHVPNLCVAQQVCSWCIQEQDITKPCEHCGLKREFIFRGENLLRDFVDFALRSTVKFKKTICIAHNAKSFDAQFILHHMTEHEKCARGAPELIMTGTKIISMRVGHTTFIDSLNYFQLPLSALPASFGIVGIAGKKGTFPHLFNSPENMNYCGPLPPIEFYSPETMSEKAREDFLAWYTEASSDPEYIFNFWDELVSYCRTDVNILRCACVAFRKIFLECGNVCPFTEAPTIASACNRFFRKHFLREETIGIIPSGGYRWGDKQSRVAIEWLLSMERALGVAIIHAGRGREYRLPEGVLVDGYFENSDASVRHVFQFHGCFWHGCTRCNRINRDRKVGNSDESMDDRYSRTRALTDKIKKCGYNVHETWECYFNRLKETDVALKEFLNNHPVLKIDKVLNPRDAFYGGRTGNTKSYYEVKDGEKIEYKDVCSLYPYISKVGKFPVGHPTLYVGHEECQTLTGPRYDLTKVEGLVLCSVLPPRQLYHPILPVRCHDKLMFSLCRTCCETLHQGDCPHEEESQRVFEGTWVSEELKKAVEAGYKIVKIHEIWQYKVLQYDTTTHKGGLFATYINMFLKIKQEASGWPSNCRDPKSRAKYIARYEQAEGIKLDAGKIMKNPGLRSVAKLCLNSFWGKFGQRDNLPKTTIVRTRQHLLQMLTKPELEVKDIVPVNDKMLYLCWVYREESRTPAPNTNVVIAAYTTAQARLTLYQYLSKLDRRVLYYDTDSCIYVSRGTPGEYVPPVGSLLGDLTDELEKDYGEGSFIRAFVSGGPKFYAYIVRAANGAESTVCKAKGITLNFKNSRIVNFDSIRDLVISNAEPMEITARVIRTTKFHQVVTRDEKKKCRVVNMKRRRVENYDSLPYGFK